MADWPPSAAGQEEKDPGEDGSSGLQTDDARLGGSVDPGG